MSPKRINSIEEIAALNLKKLRINAGFTQKDLAEKIGIDPPYISVLESGKKGIGKKMRSKLCQALNCEPKDLYSPIIEELYKQIESDCHVIDPVGFTLKQVEQAFKEKTTLSEQLKLTSIVLKALAEQKE